MDDRRYVIFQKYKSLKEQKYEEQKYFQKLKYFTFAIQKRVI